jgi:type IV pilus assembly protein PilX
MLKRPLAFSRAPRAFGQRGMVLLVALVVLVAVMIAGVAMMRSVDTATLVSGNIAFQRAATNAADKGIEAALLMLQQKSTDNQLGDNDPTNGYSASLVAATDSPTGTQSWQEFWQAALKDNAVNVGTDAFGNQIWFYVHRVCNTAGAATGSGCVASPAVTNDNYTDHENPVPIKVVTRIYYRITVRVTGPRRTESYVQSHIAM